MAIPSSITRLYRFTYNGKHFRRQLIREKRSDTQWWAPGAYRLIRAEFGVGLVARTTFSIWQLSAGPGRPSQPADGVRKEVGPTEQ